MLPAGDWVETPEGLKMSSFQSRSVRKGDFMGIGLKCYEFESTGSSYLSEADRR